MCFELPAVREAREKADRVIREAGIKRYEEKMGVQLPYSPVTVIERAPIPNSDGVVTLPANGKEMVSRNTKTVTLQPVRNNSGPGEVLRNKPKSRADYMKGWRKKPKLCPHCGKDVRLAAKQEAG